MGLNWLWRCDMRRIVKHDWAMLFLPIPIVLILMMFGVNLLIMILVYVFCAGALFESKQQDKSNK
ncbi:MAG: hypothetical protein EO766_12010 [Hydrotalea sp. AMD]|uniref:hypothetical protein n=1 Tax=Hydrotalea sp. AMD TaxID=2501297 RepID=UPI001026D91D|nr:hypothetical protein [Hydrotalea sp. AMD]RWZ87243.1 MAG: hypothetical protein EO766_12010 [Hydrotalea sp. AMD]